LPVCFRLLGELRISDGDRIVDVSRRQQRCVLTALLADVNRTVPVDTLADRVWGENLPKRPREALYSYLSRLRTALAGIDGVTLTQRSGGYLLTADPETVDLHRFHHLLGAAKDTTDERQAADLLTRALGLWSGEAFAGLDTPWVTGLREALSGRRFAAQLDLAELRLRDGDRTGGYAALAAELSELAMAHPLDERLAGLLMLALDRDGRRQDALRHYERIRANLVEELGVDPGPLLRRRHREILSGEAGVPLPGAKTPTPRQLLSAPRSFVGRTGELDKLTRALDEGAGSVVISAIGGAGGVGKTWLALQWAHHHAERFPDGQLYVNLRGFDPSGKPTPPQVAVRGFLDSLGVDPAAIPADPEARTALYRSLVAGKRLLILVDNAADSAQVAPLLPGGDSCAVLVTSRDRLAGLVTAHGARPLPLDVLDEADARALLSARLGPARLAAEPGAVGELLACCAGLPLALSIVAGRAQAHPEFPLAELAAELRDTTTRLGALDEQDSTASVRAVLSWSVTALTPEQARLFGLLGLAPGPDIGTAAVAHLCELPAGRALAALRGLERASLLQQHVPGRYRMHDLIALYAAEHARDALPESDRETALRLLADFYTHTAYAGDRLAYPHRTPSEIGPPPADDPLQTLPDEVAAQAWFDAEHLCLAAVQNLAAERGWHAMVWQLAWTLTTYHWRRGLIQDGIATWQAALAAAEALDHPAARAQAHRTLGLSVARANRYPEAMAHLEQALKLAERHDDRSDQARIHSALALVWEWRTDHRLALEHATRGLDLYRALGNPVREAQVLSLVGWLSARLGDYTAARESCEAALALFRHHRDIEGQGGTLDSLGFIDQHSGDHAQALVHYGQALDLYRDLGNTYHQANTRERLGETRLALGERDGALAEWRKALELFRAQHRTVEAERVHRALRREGHLDGL
jgi:DNA-binding SARP family transcriptional activator/tetratricopeptide (TPR) repeat protein